MAFRDHQRQLEFRHRQLLHHSRWLPSQDDLHKCAGYRPAFSSVAPIGLGTSGDLHLQSCSPAKDVGTAIGSPLTDIDGDARPFGAGIDMGFDENGESCCPA
ncbi:MAG: choice-of-anchor Q domain-containing protein [Saprospiraceae bacterium]